MFCFCSDHGGAESTVSADKIFDEPSWGTFDTHYDTDSVWGFDSDSGKVCGQIQTMLSECPCLKTSLFELFLGSQKPCF